ncbi:MAG: hemolysin family protein [Halothiobacillaceae bacterium]|jgi:CBS domain containing-hemolysin-like protein|nr:hemolysin family protein [Halothiobacillaceae bacterium]
MDLPSVVFVILLLIAVSAYFSMAEISLAASRGLRLRQMAEEGQINAQRVLDLQAQPGNFFTVVQVGLNAVAILAGIVGEGGLTPFFVNLLAPWLTGNLLSTISFTLSFVLVTALFVLLADLVPKRIAMVSPERVAVVVVRPMLFFVAAFKPVVWLFDSLANLLLRLLRQPAARDELVTSDDIHAMVDAGAQAGILRQQEQRMIGNVLELESRTLPSAMTSRESIVYFERGEREESVRDKIINHPHSRFLVCDGGLDRVVGCVDLKDIVRRLINREPLALSDPQLVRPVLALPDTLSLSEVLDRFRQARDTFAVVLNEYAMVVGLLTLDDVTGALVGEFTLPAEEEQIVRRDENTWLIDGATPVGDVMRALQIDGFPDDENYETIAGFMMYVLRKIPRRTDCVTHAGYSFEVVDIDAWRIDQLLVTRLQSRAE